MRIIDLIIICFIVGLLYTCATQSHAQTYRDYQNFKEVFPDGWNDKPILPDKSPYDNPDRYREEKPQESRPCCPNNTFEDLYYMKKFLERNHK